MAKCVFSVDVELDAFPGGGSKGIERGLPRIVSALEERGIKGTFFVTGEVAEMYPDAISGIGKRHEIGCHGYRHENMSFLGGRQQLTVLKKATEAIESVVKRPLGFRAPRLEYNSALFRNLSRLGYVYDSSVPFAGLKSRRAGEDIGTEGLAELRPIPGYILRMWKGRFMSTVDRSFRELGYAVFFTHPWEFVGVPSRGPWYLRPSALRGFHNFRGIGDAFVRKLGSVLNELSKKHEFVTAADAARELVGGK